MANKRVSELASIDATTLQENDLLLVSDVNTHTSRKVTIGDLGTFLLDEGFLSGSFYGTASYAITAATASYIGPHSSSYAPTSSWAQNVVSASYASTTTTASYSVTSSYIATASYALSSLAQSAFSASFSDYAQSASYLIFNGIPKGTASCKCVRPILTILLNSSALA